MDIRNIEKKSPAGPFIRGKIRRELHAAVLSRASDISRGRGPATFRYFREIPRNSQKREIPRNPPEIFPNTCRQNIFNPYLGC